MIGLFININWYRDILLQIKLRSFKNSEHINEKRDWPYRGFGILSLFNDPLNLAKLSPPSNHPSLIFILY